MPVATACGAMLCVVATLALSPVTRAQEPPKSDPKATGAKPADAKPGDKPGSEVAKEGVDWKPDTKLGWDKFKGGTPKKKDEDGNDLDAETYVWIPISYKCKVNGEYSFDVHAQFIPAYSTVNPKNQTPALLAHEQLHFDIWQKHAADLKKKLADIFKEKCKCNMLAADRKALTDAIDAAYGAAVKDAEAENKKYDDETKHGTKEKEQQQWAEKIAKDLGQPAPAPPPAPKAGGDDESGGSTPKAEKPAACKDCEAAEAERKKKLKALEDKLKPIAEESQKLFKQIDAIDTEIGKINADSDKAKEVLNDPKKSKGDKSAAENKIKANDGKIKSAREKQTPLKTKKDAVDKQREALELQIAPLQQPIKCPKCTANPGDSSYEPPGDEFASNTVSGRGEVCPQPEETFIPGTPGQQFSEQYASEIPGKDVPGEFVSYSVPFATDSTAYCTFGEGTGVPGYVVSTGEGGSSTPPSSGGGTDQGGTPPGPGTKIAKGDPVKPQDPLGKTPDKPGTTPRPTETPTPVANSTSTPKETPKTAETPTPTPTPKTPDQPPPTKTTENPPPDIPKTPDEPPVTIFIKASETVLDGSQPGEPIQGQVVKLVLKEKPALPTTTENRTAMDKGFDKPAPQCTTGTNGQCKFDIPAEERSLYALKDPPRSGGKPLNNYRLEVNAMKHTGGVAETTGKQVPNISAITSEGDITAEIFRIGDRNFVRFGVNTRSGVTEQLLEKFGPLLGVPIEADICLIKEPGPPLGSEPVSYRALNQELPHSSIRLRPASRRVTR